MKKLMMISSLALYGCVPIITLEDKLASGDYGFFFKTELTADKFYECLLTNKIELKDEFFFRMQPLTFIRQDLSNKSIFRPIQSSLNIFFGDIAFVYENNMVEFYYYTHNPQQWPYMQNQILPFSSPSSGCAQCT